MSVGVISLKVKVRSNINDYLNSRGTTKTWVAEQMGLKRAQIQNWSKNEDTGEAKMQPSIGYVLKMAKVLNCKVEDLYEIIEEE